MNVLQYIETHKERFLNELFDLLRIPSISAKSENKPDMLRAAEAIKNLILAAGADKAQVMSTKGNPIVYAEKMVNPSAPTVLVYGHYDVMPIEPLNEWKSQPFEPEIRDGKIFARGADDDKGQLFMHTKAFEYLNRTNSLTCNVKFMLEGEEEVGSEALLPFCEQYKEMLKADIILISDTGMVAQDIPSVTIGLRGLAYMELEVVGPNRDLHSGLFGGAVANPANVLAKIIAQLHDEQGKVTIEHFYDDVYEYSQQDRNDMAKVPFDVEAYKKAIDIADIQGENGYSTTERTGIRPTLDVNGIWGGYIQEGTKTIIPSRATAKISMRLVPNQTPEKIAELFETHVRKIAPKTVKINVKYLHGGSAYSSPTDTHAYKSAKNAYTQAFGKEPVPFSSGGSIPIVASFEKILGIKSILMGFGLESDAIHSPNENYPLFNLLKGIETISYFYSFFSQKA